MTSAPRLAVLGCGYVGTALCRLAAERGIAATGVVRSEASRARLAALGFAAVRADIVAGELAGLSGPFDRVVYCASAGGGGVAAYEAAYVAGVRAALTWAATVGARAFVFTSSTGVYRQDGDVDESSVAGGSPTADALVAGERLVLESSIPTRAVLRLGGLYGPERHYLYAQIRSGNRLISGPVGHRINYLHRDDAAAASLAAAFAEPGAYLFNVTDGQPVVKANLARWICARVAGAPPTFDAASASVRTRGDAGSPPDRAIAADAIRAALAWKPTFADVYAGLRADFPDA